VKLASRYDRTTLRMIPRLKAGSRVYALGATIAVVVGFLLSGLAQGLDHWSIDLQIAYFSARKPGQYPRIALVTVDDATLQNRPYTSPVDRQLLGDLIDRLDAAGAKIIGIDFVFDRPTEPDKDKKLIESIHKAKAKIVLSALDGRTPLPQMNREFQADFLKQAARPVGHSYFEENYNPLVPSDRVVRLIAPVSPAFPDHRSFAEVMAAADGHDARPITPYIAWLLPPKNGSETFMSLLAQQVLEGSNGAAKLPLTDLFRDKIVLIGGDFPDRDQHLTPLSVTRSQRFSGVSIHAQILAQLLDHRSIGPPPLPIAILIMVIAACGGIWVGRRDPLGHYLFWVRSIGVLGLMIIATVVFTFLGVIFPVTLTLLFLLTGTTLGYHSKRFFYRCFLSLRGHVHEK